MLRSYASHRGGVTRRVSGLGRVRGEFPERVDILRLNPPQTRQAITLD